MKNILIKTIQFLILTIFITSCSSAYYGAMEKVGVHKRDLLKKRVVNMKDSQKDTKEEFIDALTEFKKTVSFNGGKLETKYNKINKLYTKSNDQAEELKSRIKSVEKVSTALFKEWNKEIKEFTNPSLKQKSISQLNETKEKYAKMMSSMSRAESTLDPVLTVLKDNTLYLKHNLNAQAIKTLNAEKDLIENKISDLIKDMNKAILESEKFINELS